LAAIGLGARGVRHRAASGSLRRIHHGVYAVGGATLTDRGRWMAAVLACGPGAVLSHRSAADLLGLRASDRALVDVTTTTGGGRGLAKIDGHRSLTLTSADITAVEGIPCTSVARTLLDLAEVVNRRAVERAFDQAEVLQLFDRRKVDDVLARAGGRRGSAVLAAILSEHGIGRTLTRRALEEAFLALCDRSGLPRPEVNAWAVIEGAEAFEVDFLWRQERLIVETDGWEFHRTRQAFERDRARDQQLLVAGYHVVRFTWRQILNEADRLERTLHSLHAARVAGG
jgi:hypothetical protein